MRVPRFEDLEDAIIVDLDHEIFCVAKEYPRALSDHRRERERIKWEQLEKRRRARGFQGYRNCKLGISLSPSLLEKDRMRASLTTLNNIIGNNNNSYDLRSNENSNDIGTQSANGLGKTNDATHGKKSIIDSISTHVYSCVEYRSYCNRLGLSPLPDRDYNKLIASLDAQVRTRDEYVYVHLCEYRWMSVPKHE